MVYSISEFHLKVALFLFLPIHFNHREMCLDFVFNSQGEELFSGHFSDYLLRSMVAELAKIQSTQSGFPIYNRPSPSSSVLYSVLQRGHLALPFIACFPGRGTDMTQEATVTTCAAMYYNWGSSCPRSPNALWQPPQTPYPFYLMASWNLLRTQKVTEYPVVPVSQSSMSFQFASW